MKAFWPFVFLLLLTRFAAAQAIADRAAIYNEAVSQLYSDTPRALKTAEYLLKQSVTDAHKADALCLLADIYSFSGNYPKTIELLFEAKTTAGTAATPSLKAKIALGFATQCRILSLYDKAGSYLQEAEKYADSSITSKIQLEKAIIALDKGDINVIALLHDKRSNTIGFSLVSGAAFLQRGEYNKAIQYYTKAIQKGDAREKLLANNGLATVALQQNNPEKAVSLLLGVLPQLKNQDDTELKLLTYKNLANAYYTIHELKNYVHYSSLFDAVNNECNSNKHQGRILFLNLLDKEYDKAYTEEKSSNNQIMYGLGAVVLILGISGLLYFVSLNRSYNQYQKLSQVKLFNDSVTPIVVEPIAELVPAEKENQEAKPYAIPEKTEKNLLEKLSRFEESGKFTNNSISLNGLAKQLDTNTKYLSEVINTHKNGNFNTYINELRIKYILKKLQTDPVYLNYKVSYLAEESGFSSHSLFATVFKSVTGISPTTYIGFLKKEKESQPNV